MLETLCPIVSSFSSFQNVKNSSTTQEFSQRPLGEVLPRQSLLHEEIYDNLSSWTEDEIVDEIPSDCFISPVPLVFDNVLFYLDENGLALERKEYKQLMEKVIENGGKCSKYLNNNIDFFITGHGSSTRKSSAFSQKQKAAFQLNIPLVTVDFVNSCIKEDKLLKYQPFFFLNSAKSADFELGEITLITKNEKNKQAYHSFKNVPSNEYTPNELNNFILLKYVQLKGKTTTGNVRDPSVNYQFFILELHASLVDDYDIPSQYCIFTHEGEIAHLEKGKKLCRYVSTVEEALNVYGTLLKQMSGAPKYLMHTNEYLSESLGSPSFRQIQLELHYNVVNLEPSVIYTIDILWNETKNSLSEVLEGDPLQIPSWKIKAGEKIITQLGSLLKNGNNQSIIRLSKEFYNNINFKTKNRDVLSTFAVLNDKYNLIKKLHDLIKLKESYPIDIVHNPEARCRALRCTITKVSEDADDYENICNLIINGQTENTNIKIHNVYKISRNAEAVLFRDSLGNIKQLFHGTLPDNLMGIFSRGLQVQNLIGGEIDPNAQYSNLLGPGIYFTDSSSYCTKYCKPNALVGTRMVLVCEVSLGKVYQTSRSDPKITSPPAGYDSILGEKNDGSEFYENEYVIFDQCQTKLQYLVEYSLPEDKIFLKDIAISSYAGNTMGLSAMNVNAKNYSFDIANYINDDTEAVGGIAQGLECVNPFHNIHLSLKSIHIKAEVVDLVAKVYLFQEYKNDSENHLEVKYIFPLETGSAICGFEAFIGTKHIIGEVKEKETARGEYESAKKEGHGAYLLEGTSQNIFTIQIGNLPPKTRAIIKITFIAELNIENDTVEFIMPSLFQKVIYGDEKPYIKPNFSFQASIEMAREILSITSPSHEVISKKTETKAVVKLLPTGENMLLDLKLNIRVKDIHVPRMWIEKHPDRDTRACMVTFYPKFNFDRESNISSNGTNIMFLLDASDSMKGDDFQNLIYIVLLSLELMKPNTLFNIVAYGTTHWELFPDARPFSLENHAKAKQFLSDLLPNLGKSQLSQTLRSYQLLLLNRKNDVLLVTNSIRNEESDILKLNLKMFRVFSFGVGNNTEHHLLRLLAHKTGGSHISCKSMEKDKWKFQVRRVLERSRQPSLTNIQIDWQNEDNVMQAPFKLYSIFNGSSQIIYALDTFCTMATLKAKIDEQEVSTVVASYELSQTTGTLLHSLAARAYVKDWEDGILNENEILHLVSKEERKETITNLAKEYSLVTSLTSFVAVEKRSDSNESFSDIDIESLIANVDVDILSYVEFSVDVKDKMGVPNGSLRDDLGLSCNDSSSFADEDASFSADSDSCSADYGPSSSESDCFSVDRDCNYGSSSTESDCFPVDRDCNKDHMAARSLLNKKEPYLKYSRVGMNSNIPLKDLEDYVSHHEIEDFGELQCATEPFFSPMSPMVGVESSDRVVRSRTLSEPNDENYEYNENFPKLATMNTNIEKAFKPAQLKSSNFLKKSQEANSKISVSGGNYLKDKSSIKTTAAEKETEKAQVEMTPPPPPGASARTLRFARKTMKANPEIIEVTPSNEYEGFTLDSSSSMDLTPRFSLGPPQPTASSIKPTLPITTGFAFGSSYPIGNAIKPASAGFTFGCPSTNNSMIKPALPVSTRFASGVSLATDSTIKCDLLRGGPASGSSHTYYSASEISSGHQASAPVASAAHTFGISCPILLQSRSVISERSSVNKSLDDQPNSEVQENEIARPKLLKKKKKKLAIAFEECNALLQNSSEKIENVIAMSEEMSNTSSNLCTADGPNSDAANESVLENISTESIKEILCSSNLEIILEEVLTVKSNRTNDFNKAVMFMENNLKARGGNFPIMSAVLDCFWKDLRKRGVEIHDFSYYTMSPSKKLKTENSQNSLWNSILVSIKSMEIELRNNGLSSLGTNIVGEVLKMIIEVTKLQIYFLYLLMGFAKENVEILMELESSFSHVIKSLNEMPQDDDLISSAEFLAPALDNLIVFDKKYPLLYNVLTQSKSWEGFVFSHLKKNVFNCQVKGTGKTMLF